MKTTELLISQTALVPRITQQLTLHMPHAHVTLTEAEKKATEAALAQLLVEAMGNPREEVGDEAL